MAIGMAGVGLANGFFDYKRSKAKAKYARQMQEWRNKMVQLNNALNQNSITQNTTNAIQRSAEQAVFNKAEEMSVLGASSVQAAAAGVRGNSVNATFMNFQRQAALKEKGRQDDLQQQFTAFYNQRLQSGLSATHSTDYSHIESPKLGQYLFNAGAKSLDQGVNTIMSAKTGGLSSLFGGASGGASPIAPKNFNTQMASQNNWGG